MELNDVRRMAEELMDLHGLDDWSFVFDRAVRRAGKCSYRDRTISLSAPLAKIHDEDEVRETVLHEIAHALTPGEGHSAVWRRTALRIGSNGRRCIDVATPQIPGAWQGTCPAGHTVQRHRAPQRVVSCSQCSRGFDPAHVFTWTHHGGPGKMPASYVLEAERMRQGRPAVVVGVGARVRIVVPGNYDGVVGTVVKRTRVNYVVRTRSGMLRVPHAGAVPE